MTIEMDNNSSSLYFRPGIDVIMEYAPSCARVVVVLSRDFLKHEWSHYQARLEILHYLCRPTFVNEKSVKPHMFLGDLGAI